MQLSNTQSAETPGLHTADAPHSQMRYKDVTLIQITQAVLTVWLYVRDNSFHGSRHTELSWKKRRQWAMRTIRPSLTLPSPGSRSHWACVRGQRSQTSDSHCAEKSHTCGDVEEEGINNEFFLFSWPVHFFFFLFKTSFLQISWTDKSICCHWFTSVWGLLRDQCAESRSVRLNTDHVWY